MSSWAASRTSCRDCDVTGAGDPSPAGVQPRQNPGGTLRMNGVGEIEREDT